MPDEMVLWPVYTRGDTRASSASPPVWATPTCASDGHPVIDEVAIHRHPASCNIGASLSGQLSVRSLCLPVTSRDGQNHHMLMILKSNHLNKCDLKSFCKWWFENQNHIKNQMILKSFSKYSLYSSYFDVFCLLTGKTERECIQIPFFTFY